MRIVRFQDSGGEVRAGVLDGDLVTGFAAAGSLAGLLALPLDQLREACAHPGGATTAVAGVRLLAPVDGRTDLWAAGVTYERSRTARMAESGQSATVLPEPDRRSPAGTAMPGGPAWRRSPPRPP